MIPDNVVGARHTDCHKTKVCAVIITYNGGAVVAATVNAVFDQVDYLIIVDNHSDALTVRHLKALSQQRSDKLMVVYNDTNRGLAAALNQGIRLALERRCDWILTLDQDSFAEARMVAQMLEAYNCAADQPSIAIIAPRSVLIADGQARMSPDTAAEPAVEVNLIHTSGNLVKAEVFKRVGWFREDYFIDQVDYEFCFRVRKAGFRILISRDAVMRHRLGDLKSARFFGKRVFHSNYSAIRRYYITRNGIILSREIRDWRFLKSHVLLVAKESLKVLLYEDQKWEKSRLTLKGLKDGLAGKLGRLNG
ncbi:MAG TPA: glycosyltransferase family 2 protein [Blastocatellia bacterium]|nr:glycosyltransferase family 2 protein [Blastocatellia bacterium]